jgi:hypothetical protein
MPLTFTELLQRANILVQRLRSAGVDINPSSRLAAYVRELEAIIPLQYRTPPEEMLRRCHRSLIEVEDLAEAVEAVSSSPEIVGWHGLAEECVGGAFLREDDARNVRPRNAQFELVLASLLRRAGYLPEFAEPDVLVKIVGHEVAIAAKRPSSRAKVQKLAKEGAAQIIDRNLQGLVAVDMSVVANPLNKHLVSTNFAAAQRFVVEQARRLAQHVAGTIGVRFGTTHVFGAITRFTLPVWEPRQRHLSFANQWTIVALVPPSDSRRVICEDLLARGLAAETAA